ncbi:hypothetical protein [Pleurocapsa sp. PCC 7319]|uniref:hypothetical protein n=1 Tax=Pleurocapsa sp. PCC 7319 TaxID=118161 RepID=UPI0003491230|nr:hypothetical protein [Pleurocapsa sp. PCC 7319]
MQLKLVSLIALVFGTTFVTAHIASSGYIVQPTIATVSRQSPAPPRVDHSIPSLPGKLALNESQQKSIVQINRKFTHKIHEILTVRQLQQFRTSLARGLTLHPALNTLSLTSKQQNKLRIALQLAQRQIQQVLTPAQLQYIKQREFDEDKINL